VTATSLANVALSMDPSMGMALYSLISISIYNNTMGSHNRQQILPHDYVLLLLLAQTIDHRHQSW